MRVGEVGGGKAIALPIPQRGWCLSDPGIPQGLSLEAHVEGGELKGGFPQESPYSYKPVFPWSPRQNSSVWVCGERGFQLN